MALRPHGNTYKGKGRTEILKEIHQDLPGAVGIRTLRSGDIRIVLKIQNGEGDHSWKA